MCKLNSQLVAFLCFFAATGAYLQGAPSIVLTPTADALCTANPYISFLYRFTDDGTFGTENFYILEYSSDGITQWKELYRTKNVTWGYTQRPVNLQEGWYRISAARLTEESMPELWLNSEPVYMEKIEGGCTPFRNPWPDEISDNVCPRGTLLFREDFGGNDPSDPETSQTPLIYMSSRYTQFFDILSRVRSGLFIVAKHGWQNNLNTSTTADLYSQWFIQDDHTYPNDYTRGYLLEVDGVGGSDAFYSTSFPVCQELDLSFSAYVANVLEPGHNFTRPKVRFLIQDEQTGNTIMEQSSGDIDPAPANYRERGIPSTLSAPWHLVGTTFHVPAGVNSIRLSIFNDVTSSSGNDFAIDDIEIRLCNPTVSIHSPHEICMDSSYVFKTEVTADGGFLQPYNYLWQYATDSLPFNSDEWTNLHTEQDLSFDSIRLSDEGWYRLCVTSNGVDAATERSCRAMSEPFHLIVHDCTPPCPELQYMSVDTTVCDTLMPFLWHDTLVAEPRSFSILYKNKYGCDSLLATYNLQTEICCPELQYATVDSIVCDTLMPILWHDTLLAEPRAFSILYESEKGCDSLLVTYNLQTEICCPELQYATVDSIVCDTLMPILWMDTLLAEPRAFSILYASEKGCDSLLATYNLQTEICCYDMQYAYHDTLVCDTLLPFEWHGLRFDIPAEQEWLEFSPRGCDSIMHTLYVDTFHCERLYPIIVNKYNWQLLCDNVALRRLFPGRSALAFQWYKNEEAVPGATVDDYSERNELHGVFQLRVTLDGNEIIWSNILVIGGSIEEKPLHLTVYNSRGEQVDKSQVSHGMYIYRFEQGNSIWTEKRLIP